MADAAFALVADQRIFQCPYCPGQRTYKKQSWKQHLGTPMHQRNHQVLACIVGNLTPVQAHCALHGMPDPNPPPLVEPAPPASPPPAAVDVEMVEVLPDSDDEIAIPATLDQLKLISMCVTCYMSPFTNAGKALAPRAPLLIQTVRVLRQYTRCLAEMLLLTI